MKKVLVTGGAGFIGSHLCEALVKDGYKVYSLDNYFTGTRPDLVFHLGEYSRVEQSFEDIDKIILFNKIGTAKVLEFCRKRKSKLVYAGSSTKFCDGDFGKNQSPYAYSKSANTELIKNYGSWYGLDYAIVYFYNAYGESEIKSGKYATLIALFCEKMRKGEKLTVVSPGIQKRNFTHIDDIVAGLMLVGKHGQGDEYGIGNEQTYTILEIAKMFGGEVEMLPERAGNRMRGEVKTDKIRALGWKPQKSIKEYIENFTRQLKKVEQ